MAGSNIPVGHPFIIISTACVCPLVFGFPTEMGMAHSLFWPTLAVCHYGRGGLAGIALVFPMLLALVLTHAPNMADRAAEHGQGLILAGHTHGGHVNIPKVTAGIARRLGNRYLAGFYRVGNSLLYVNCGIGSSSSDSSEW